MAGRADLERALYHGGRSRRAGLAGRHHVVERWILGTGRRLFALGLTHHQPCVDRGGEPDPLDPQSCYPCRMATPPPIGTSRWIRQRRLTVVLAALSSN